MKKLSTIILAAAAIILSSCHHSRVTILTRSNNYETRLQYSGSMAFSNDRTKIEAISKGGFIDYKRNDDELRVLPDGAGRVKYELNGDQVNTLDTMGQNMLQEAIRIIIKSRH